MTAAAVALLDAWALRTGRAASTPVEPELPETNAKADVIYRVPPETLIIPGYDDKQEGDPDRNVLPLDEAMTLSVMALGVLEPIIVRRTDAGYEVVAGRRRTRHAREANRRLVLEDENPLTVPVLVKGARLSSEMAFIVDTTLNEHRLNDPVSVKVRKATKMLAKGIDVNMIAVAFRVEPAQVSVWTKAASSCPQVQEVMDAGRLSVTAAAELAQLPPEEQVIALERVLSVPASPSFVRRTVRAARRREPLPGRVPKRAVRWVLDGAGQYADDFIKGIRFVRGELAEEEVREILARVGR